MTDKLISLVNDWRGGMELNQAGRSKDKQLKSAKLKI